MSELFSRQSFLGPDSERILSENRVAIVGLGGGGSHIAQQLAHIGVGRFLLIDHDHFEEPNHTRTVGAAWSDIANKTLKAEIARRHILGINPHADIICTNSEWQTRADLLRDCDVIIGCVDTLRVRRDLETAARRYLTPYIDIGMDVHPVNGYFVVSGQVILSMPGRPCMRCMGILTEEALALEAQKYGAAGGRPQVIWPNGVLASTAVGIFIQLVTPWHKSQADLAYFEYDGNAHSLKVSNRLAIIRDVTCAHFHQASDLGDPFWN